MSSFGQGEDPSSGERLKDERKEQGESGTCGDDAKTEGMVLVQINKWSFLKCLDLTKEYLKMA